MGVQWGRAFLTADGSSYTSSLCDTELAVPWEHSCQGISAPLCLAGIRVMSNKGRRALGVTSPLMLQPQNSSIHPFSHSLLTNIFPDTVKKGCSTLPCLFWTHIWRTHLLPYPPLQLNGKRWGCTLLPGSSTPKFLAHTPSFSALHIQICEYFSMHH